MALNSKTFSILCSNQRVKGHLKQARKILPVAFNVKNIHRHEAHLAKQKGRNKGLKDLPELKEEETGERERSGRERRGGEKDRTEKMYQILVIG